MKNTFQIMLLWLAPVISYTQVEVNHKIILTSNLDSLSQLEGLKQGKNLYNSLRADDIISNSFIYSDAITTSDTINLQTPLINSYSTGMKIYFKADTSINKSVYIKINNLSTHELKRYTLDSIGNGDIVKDQMISIVFNFDHFQILNQKNKDCPKDFIFINNSYCIEPEENTALTYHESVMNCRAKNARLCSWNEWYYACSQFSSQVNNTINNYEWIGDAANENYQIKTVGFGSCESNSVSGTSNTYNYRCCFSR